MIKAELNDVVEILVDIPEQNLRAGAQGTIVHQHDVDVYEVEFTGENGETIALCSIPQRLFIIVWQASQGKHVPLPEQIAQIVSRLPQEAGAEVLDFARFLSVRMDQLTSE
jgi:hypothetical protein